MDSPAENNHASASGFFRHPGILLTCVAATTLHVVERLDEALTPQILSNPRHTPAGADTFDPFGDFNALISQLMYSSCETGDPVKLQGVALGDRLAAIEMPQDFGPLGHLDLACFFGFWQVFGTVLMIDIKSISLRDALTMANAFAADAFRCPDASWAKYARLVPALIATFSAAGHPYRSMYWRMFM